MSLNDPFFIVGCGRSGTSLLKAILSAHKDIYVAPETLYFQSIDSKMTERSKVPEFIASRWWMMDEDIKAEDIRPMIDEDASLIQRSDDGFKAVLQIFQSRYPNSILGEKTARHVGYVNRIRRCVPDAKFIQIIRDPRAVLASYKKAKIGSNQPYFIAREWLSAINVLETNRENEFYHFLSYEGLTKHSNDVLTETIKFLSVPWDEGIMSFHSRSNAGFPKEQKHMMNTLKPIFTSNIDSWKDVLSKREIALIEYQCGSKMEKYGYELMEHKIAFPKLWLKVSFILGIIRRSFISYPSKKIKSYKVKSRIRKGS